MKTQRYESPVKGPQGLAWDGKRLWITSAANGRIYEIDPRTWTVQNEFSPPYEALGIAYTGTDFRLVLAPAIEEEDLELDHRHVYGFSPDAGFNECFVCPDQSGSFLAYDGSALFLCQAWDKRLLQLDEAGKAARSLELPRRPVGIHFVDGTLYVASVNDDWLDSRIERVDISGNVPQTETIGTLPYKVRGITFDGARFWVADRNNDALEAFTL